VNKTRQLDQLVSRVDGLLARLPEEADSEIGSLREQIDSTIFETWTVVAREHAEARATMLEAIEAVNGYVRRHRWACVAAALVFAASAGLKAGRMTRRPD
jgi:ElaB/YqjD/DUF883 family membrane-anchored ribosome-binding protein